MNSRERILALIEGREVDHLPLMPITMQFACDRIGAQYLDYATDYRLLVEGQLRVAEEFGLDYVNTMSDPACEAVDCGAKVVFHSDSPAAVDEGNPLLDDKRKLAHLLLPDPCGGGRMHNRLRALSLLKERVGDEKLIEGWIEGPCAEAADLRGLSNLMVDFYDDPGFVRDLFEFALEMELQFAQAQVVAGADMIGIGDAAASLVGPKIYAEFVWPYEQRMIEAIHAMGVKVRLHICGNTRRLLPDLARLGSEIVDLDYLTPVAEGREKMGKDQVILGNIDPVRILSDGTPEQVTAAIAECHRQAGSRFIVGAGCETPRETPLANFQAMADYAHTHRA